MRRKLRFLFTVLAMAFASIIIYVLLHESGHALVAMLCGGSNVRISIISAHTWWTGGSFTAITSALCDAAGAALPICAAWIAMMFYSKDCKSLIYHLAYGWFFIGTTSSAFAWVLVPVYSMFAPFPDQTDDAVKFLNVSGIPPVAIALTAAAVILLSIFIAVKKRLFQTLVRLARDVGLGGANSEVETLVSNKSMLGVSIAVLIAVCVAVLPELPDMMVKPVVSFAIADEVPEEETRRTFDIQRESMCHFQTRLDAEGILVVVSISNQDQELMFQNLIYDAVDSNSTFYLSPGTYSLSVTYLTDAGVFDRYWSAAGYSFEEQEMETFAEVYEQEARLSELFVELKQTDQVYHG